MKTYQLEILEPKATKLLEELVKLKLIRMQVIPDQTKEFNEILAKLRAKRTGKPTMREISKEVEIVRRGRHQNR